MKRQACFLLIVISLFVVTVTTYAQTGSLIVKEKTDSLMQEAKDTLMKRRTNVVKQNSKDSLKQNPTTQPTKEATSKAEENVVEKTNTTPTEENKTALIVEVYERNSMELLDGVEVYLFSMPDKEHLKTKTSQNGTVSFLIDENSPYEIRACKVGYAKKGMSIFDCNREDKLFCLRGVLEFYHGPPHTLEGQLLAKIAVDPLAIGQTIELDNVYYDLGKSTLRSESKSELNKVYGLLKQYKTLVIELSSHTDSRGGDDFNLQLSTNRAKSCFQYLVDKGIAPERIKHRGYGETVLLNECDDGVPCAEKQHQRNRRTEISILELEPEPCKPEL